MMKRFLFASCIGLAGIGFSASQATAQSSNPCCCVSGNSVSVANPMPATPQPYQRFSYEPTTAIPSQNMNGVIQNQSSVVRSAPTVQNYQRFSYQPTAMNRSNASGYHKNLWEYSKADPRKYRP